MQRHHDMQIFQALSERHSLMSVAAHLGVSVATVTRAIDRLEARLNQPLLLRSTRGVSLTGAGIAYLADCSRILQEVANSEASAQGLHQQARGNLSLFAPRLFNSYILPPILAGYLKQCPQMKVFMRLHDRSPGMLEEGIDVALVIGELPGSSLIARPVGHVHTITCASPAYLATQGTPQVPADLKTHSLIASQGQREWLQWSFQHQGQTLSIKARPRLACATLQGAINIACSGAGLVQSLSYPLFDHLQSGQLCRVLQPYEPAPVPVHLVYREGHKASMRVRSFVDYALPRLRAHPALLTTQPG